VAALKPAIPVPMIRTCKGMLEKSEIDVDEHLVCDELLVV
jgi:hypothetical protein